MPTLHIHVTDAEKEAIELLTRYRQSHSYIIKHENIYGELKNEPGYEALIQQEMTAKDRKKICAIVYKHKIFYY